MLENLAMNIIAVDDEAFALEALALAITQAVPGAELKLFRLPREVIEFAKAHSHDFVIDIAFLDVEMGAVSGLSLAAQLKKINPKVNIIFVTGHSEYMGSAFDIRASGYILKPARPEDIRNEIENLRFPIEVDTQGIRAQTFGNFELFVDNSPVAFGRSKSKEILAYLIDRKGAAVTRKELAGILWENGAYTRAVQDYLQKLLADMLASLKAAGAEKIIIKKHNAYAIDPKAFDCDYYNYLNWDPRAVNSFNGEYMTNYSWAEFTTGRLFNQKNTPKPQ